MKRLRDHVVENAPRETSAKRRRDRTGNAGEVRVIRSLGLDAATVALPAGVDLETRAARMNSFWEALVDFQHQDVIVVALASRKEW